MAKLRTIALSDKEQRSVLMGISGVSTASFYKGQPPIDFLQRRVAEFLSANPWLTSKMVRCSTGIVLQYTSDDAYPDCLEVVANSKLCRHIDEAYEDVVQTLLSSGYCVASGYETLLSGARLFKVVILVHPGHFVLVSSLSHILGDGHTYYALHNMLDPSEQVFALDRHLVDLEESELEAVGQAEYAVLASSSAMLGMAKNASVPYGKAWLFEVDVDQVEAAKSEKTSLVPFLSTNDVLTSAFFAATSADFALMAVNLRGRLEGICELSAGNYEHCVYYVPADFCPSAIRKSISNGRMRRHSTDPLPDKVLTEGRIVLITNWSTFAKKAGVVFEGCEMLVHLPLPDALGFKDYAIIFQSRPGEIGMLCRGHGLCQSEDSLRISVLGEMLGARLQHAGACDPPAI